jgi:probable DNA metabolism protein
MFVEKTTAVEEVQLVYDGTYEGLLTVVFECYRLKLTPTEIQVQGAPAKDLFANRHPLTITTDKTSAQRVAAGIAKYGGRQTASELYQVFLSENGQREMVVYQYLRLLFEQKKAINAHYHIDVVLQVSQLVKQMGREIHRMHAFVRFQELADGLYFAPIEPDFDVLPLAHQHFVKRYAAMRWCIYDIKRNYGLLYDGGPVQTVVLDMDFIGNTMQLPAEVLSANELTYQQLWKDYFKSTNITERKNLKLHLRHVPSRYWKYLTEKW